MSLKTWLLTTILLISMGVGAQDISVRGVVVEEKLDGSLVPVEFANVYFEKSTRHTTTDSTGYFFLPMAPEDGFKLIVQFLGFLPDTITVYPGQYLSVLFKEEASVLDEVVVAHRKRTTEVSFLDPMQVQKISSEELFKAACCNLSESFETNATVDVSFTDAITGAKEIQMLGLSGKYSLLSQEQMPGTRGIAVPYGLLYMPGPWIESIQITKGVGSVVQGYESMTGQINVEVKKPFDKEKLHINGFFGESYRSELNVFTRTDVSPMFSTALMGHYSLYPTEHDRNGDGFMDMPSGSLLTLANRWDYHNNKSGVEGQLNVQYVRDRKEAGQVSHGEAQHDLYRADMEGDRLQVYGKLGYVFPKKRYNSFGSQWGYVRHTQDALIGHTTYEGKQSTLYANLLYQSIIGDTRHKYVTGFSFRYDDYYESSDVGGDFFTEVIPGAFLEYTYLPDNRLTAVLGLRLDHHNIYGWLFNPRLHLRYAPRETTVFRASAGKGMRMSVPIPENFGWLASSRQWTIGNPSGEEYYPYNGLKMEEAWNFGASFTQEFTLDYRSGVVSVDFYRTQFLNRVITDLDHSPQEVLIYNLEGESYANTFQAEAQYEIMKRLDFKIAYKLQDVQITYRDAGLRRQVFTPRDRFFANLSYVSSVATYKGHWRASLTSQYTGQQRIPDTYSNPEEFQMPSESPAYWIFLGQLTRVFNKEFEVYVGCENIFNFKQDPVIIDPDDPHGPYFDSAMIWGPIFGREWYVGFRYSLK
jgi:outer membrane receptor for ferrienterochelin and colicin